MATAVRVSSQLLEKAKIKAKAFKRSVAGQIEYWSQIGEIAESNPQFTFEHIQAILVALEEVRAHTWCHYSLGDNQPISASASACRQLEALGHEERQRALPYVVHALSTMTSGQRCLGLLSDVYVTKFMAKAHYYQITYAKSKSEQVLLTITLLQGQLMPESQGVCI